ncbi:MAG: serine hydrolase, partial [Bacteroidota bacterium]
MKNISSLLFLLTCFCLFSLRPNARAQGALDQPFDELGWQSWRGMSESDYEKKLDDLKADGYRPIDVEVKGGSQRTYSAIWRKNSDSRKWVVKTKLTDADFHQQWTNYKNQGYRPADQESHLLGNTRYYGAIWIENKENLGWYSFRNQTSNEFHEKYEELKGKYIPVDVDAYEVGNETRYSAIWVENKENIGWYIKRNLSASELDQLFDEQSDKGFRLYDIEGYERNNKLEYAAIFVKESKGRKWYGRWGMTDTWFHNYWAQYRDMGFRIEDLEVYQTSAGTRYAGVWVENSDIVQWSEKDEVNKLIEDYLKANPTAGMSVAIAVNGKIKYKRGFGLADVSASKQADSETIYRLASVSKAVTGTLAFRLKDKGKIDLNKKTRDYESRLPAHHTHTVGQLLSNRGKVRHYLDDDPLSAGTTEVYTS